MKNPEIKKLLSDEQKQIEKLHDIVKKSIDDQELIIRNLAQPTTENLTVGQAVSYLEANAK